MNTEEVFSLVRSGALFAALSPTAGRNLHNIRRALLLDCPNTYREMEVEDQGVARGQSMEDVLTVLLDYIQHPRFEHAHWCTAEEAVALCSEKNKVEADATGCDAIFFSTEEDPFFNRGCVLHTVPRKAEFVAGRGLLSLETPEIPRTLKEAAPTFLHRVTGTELNSLAMLRKSLCPNIRHRCSIQVLSLPNAGTSQSSPVKKAIAPPPGDEEGTTASPSATPQSPSRKLVTDHASHKPYAPHCSFGIFCPSEPKEALAPMSLQSHGSVQASRRWLGVSWSDGSSVPTLGLLSTVSTTGVVRCPPLQNSPLICVGDVLTIETRPLDDTVRDGTAGHVVVFLNGKEVSRLSMKLYCPTATRLAESYFAVRLSEGASVAVFYDV